MDIGLSGIEPFFSVSVVFSSFFSVSNLLSALGASSLPYVI